MRLRPPCTQRRFFFIDCFSLFHSIHLCLFPPVPAPPISLLRPPPDSLSYAPFTSSLLRLPPDPLLHVCEKGSLPVKRPPCPANPTSIPRLRPPLLPPSPPQHSHSPHRCCSPCPTLQRPACAQQQQRPPSSPSMEIMVNQKTKKISSIIFQNIPNSPAI